jgi:hypothetical protein
MAIYDQGHFCRDCGSHRLKRVIKMDIWCNVFIINGRGVGKISNIECAQCQDCQAIHFFWPQCMCPVTKMDKTFTGICEQCALLLLKEQQMTAILPDRFT